MTVDSALSSAFGKYVTFSGRAPRSEFWWFLLFTWAIHLLLGVIEAGLLPAYVDAETGAGPLNGLWSLFTLLPTISVSVRRLHDLGRSGWWWWLWLVPLIGSIILLVWFCLRGTQGPNAHGPDPLAPPAPPPAGGGAAKQPWQVPHVPGRGENRP